MNAMDVAALTVAGSDSSGGAGLQADLRAFAACGVIGASAVTALTAQNASAVRGILPIPPSFVAAQVDAVLEALPVRAIKTGMMGEPALIEEVARSLRGWGAGAERPLVVDPVMVATSGATLLPEAARQVLLEQLVPLATLVTPNLPEAALMIGEDPAEAPGWPAERQAAAAVGLLATGSRAVLVKGGHGSGGSCDDVLATASGIRWFRSPRLEVASTHGTGCTLSAAITAALAHGLPVERAVQAGRAYVTRALLAGLHRPQAPFDVVAGGLEP